MDRYGRLRLLKHPTHGLVLESTDRAVLTEVLRSRKVAPDGGRPDRRRHGRGASQRARRAQAGAAAPRAGRPRTWPATSTARRTRSSCARTAGRCATTSARPPRASGTAAPGSSCCPAGPARRWSGAAAMDLARATTLILVTNTVVGPAVARRAAAAHEPDRGGDRRVLRGAQGGPPGHDRHLPGDDDQAEGHLRAPRPVRRPRLGPDHLRRGAPAAGPDLPVHRRHPGPAPARPDRDAGPRGRPRGRRLLPDRAQALRRAVARDRGAGLDRPGGLRRGPGDPARRPADGLRDGRARRALPDGGHRAARSRGSSPRWWPATPTTRSW